MEGEMKNVGLTLLLTLLTILACGCTGQSSETEATTLYQKCLACTSVYANEFHFNMLNGKPKCGKSITQSPDDAKISDGAKCQDLKPVCPPTGPSFVDPRGRNESLPAQPIAITCSSTCPSVDVLCPKVNGKSGVTITTFQQCVLCTEDRRHFSINLLTSESRCVSGKTSDDRLVFVSTKERCDLFKALKSNGSG